MAVLAQNSDQMADGYRGRPVDDFGKIRIAFFSFTNGAVAGDANSTVELCKLPPGAKRILPGLSRVSTSAFGAARTLSIGHRAYTKQNTEAGGAVFSTDEAASANALVNAMDISGAVNGAAFGTSVKYDMFSHNEITLYATVAGGTTPAAATISGYVAYVYE
jgi:hypothetical protein